MWQAIIALLCEHGPLIEPELVARLGLQDPRDIIRLAEALVCLRRGGLTIREAQPCHCDGRPRHHHYRICLTPTGQETRHAEYDLAG